jgi:hypothetical protein
MMSLSYFAGRIGRSFFILHILPAALLPFLHILSLSHPVHPSQSYYPVGVP